MLTLIQAPRRILTSLRKLSPLQILSPLRLGGALSVALALVGSTARAGHGEGEGSRDGARASTLRVIGQASVMSPPDQVKIDFGVVTRAETAQQAAAENARMLQNVLSALRRELGPGADIETISYVLRPDYRYPPEGEPELTGYTATNLVRVTEDDLSNVGALIDTATRGGANRVERIQFTLKDPDAAQARALRRAAEDARAKAGRLASALGLQVIGIRSVIETGETPRPFYELDVARIAATTTPIVPGAIETTATVTLTAEAGRGTGMARPEPLGQETKAELEAELSEACEPAQASR